MSSATAPPPGDSPHRYDVLVLDLDGTLLGPGGLVADEDRVAVAEARDAGLEIIVATGRALVESLAPLEAIEHTGTIVTAGGSMLCDVASGRTLARHAMEPALVADVTACLVRHDHKVLLLKDSEAAGYDYLAVGHAPLDPASEWWFETLPVRVRFVRDLEDDPHPEDTVRVGAVATEGDLAPIARLLHDEVGERGFLQHWSAVTATEATGSATHLLEVFGRDVNKWTMVHAHCTGAGRDPRRVVAIGDGLNDVEIVREAGLGVAMGNADARVREVADRVTRDHRSGGVAHAIGHVLAGRW